MVPSLLAFNKMDLHLAKVLTYICCKVSCLLLRGLVGDVMLDGLQHLRTFVRMILPYGALNAIVYQVQIQSMQYCSIVFFYKETHRYKIITL